MLILALESSAKAASAALCRDGVLIAQSQQCSGLTHSCTLLPMAEQMLKDTNIALSDVDAIAVARGPGSFTGIRIGEGNYEGTLSGELSNGTAVLTLKNLPASVLTGSDSNQALAVTCSIKMDTVLLGDITTSARMSVWVER